MKLTIGIALFGRGYDKLLHERVGQFCAHVGLSPFLDGYSNPWVSSL